MRYETETIHKIACLSSFAAVATSCLDLEPKANLSDSTVWDKASNFQLFADQFYGWVADFATAIGDNVHSDFRSDLLCGSSVNTYSQGTNTIPTSDGNYGTNYKRIYYTNLLLKMQSRSVIRLPLPFLWLKRSFSVPMLI